MDPILRQIQDENEIRKLVVSFSLAMDARDTDLFRRAWSDEVELDLPPVGGNVILLSGTRRADDYARDVIDLLTQFEVTQHISTNHLISVTGDTATCTCYTLAQHYMHLQAADPRLTAGARYDLVAQRFDELGWRFTKFKLTGLWSCGNPSLWLEATRRLAQNRFGRSR